MWSVGCVAVVLWAVTRVTRVGWWTRGRSFIIGDWLGSVHGRSCDCGATGMEVECGDDAAKHWVLCRKVLQAVTLELEQHVLVYNGLEGTQPVADGGQRANALLGLSVGDVGARQINGWLAVHTCETWLLLGGIHVARGTARRSMRVRLPQRSWLLRLQTQDDARVLERLNTGVTLLIHTNHNVTRSVLACICMRHSKNMSISPSIDKKPPKTVSYIYYARSYTTWTPRVCVRSYEHDKYQYGMPLMQIG